jgi:hypothetical protein
MTCPYPRRSALTRLTLLAALTGLSACDGSGAVGPASVAGQVPDATVEMREVQVAYIGSGGGGTGTLHYKGRSYPFTIAGLGVGGIGASRIEATGEVYNLSNLSRFPGAYGQARYGFALGRASGGELWLQNDAGVIMRLNARREGLMLSLGGDAM